MTIRQIEHFIALAEIGNFTKASERLYISQPGFSSSIRQIEFELGVQLILRTKNGIKLTDAGKLFYEYAKNAFNEYNLMIKELEGVANPSGGTVVLGYISTISDAVLPRFLNRFYSYSEASNITVELKPFHTYPDLKSAYDDTSIDCMIYYSAESTSRKLIIGTQDLILATPLGHPLTNKSLVKISDLVQYKICCPPVESDLYGLTIRLFKQYDLKPDLTAPCPDWQTMVAYTSMGKGISLVPPNAAHSANISVKSIDDPLIHRDIYFSVANRVYKSKPIVKTFFSICKTLEL